MSPPPRWYAESMDETPKFAPVMLAPGASSGSSSYDLPSKGSRPRVSDHLVVPELTREEVVCGERMQASPAKPPHGDQHTEVDYVVRAHARRGHVVSTDLLTRFTEKSDFATDASVRKAGIDPATGDRHLEELAFEVVSEQSLADVTRRAREMSERGVRRVFAILVKKGEVREWSAKLGAWQPLGPDDVIRDKTLSTPIPIKALLDSAEADDAVVGALEEKGNRRIEAIKARSKAEDVLLLLEARGLEVPEDARARILACRDLELLRSWLRRAAVTKFTAAIFEETK